MQASVQELKDELMRLREANSVATSSREVVTRFEGDLTDAQAQNEREHAPLRKWTNAEWDVFYATVGDHSCLQLLLNAEAQERQSVERTTSSFRTSVSDH